MTLHDRRCSHTPQLHRYAIVVGNSNHQAARHCLQPGIADARSVQEELEGRGFQVTPWGTCIDLTGPQLQQKLSTFVSDFRSRLQRRSEEAAADSSISEVLALSHTVHTPRKTSKYRYTDTLQLLFACCPVTEGKCVCS